MLSPTHPISLAIATWLLAFVSLASGEQKDEETDFSHVCGNWQVVRKPDNDVERQKHDKYLKRFLTYALILPTCARCFTKLTGHPLLLFHSPLVEYAPEGTQCDSTGNECMMCNDANWGKFNPASILLYLSEVLCNFNRPLCLVLFSSRC